MRTPTPDQATALVRRHVDPALTIASVRPMHGGSIHRVLELFTDATPTSLVLKLGTSADAPTLRREHEALTLLRSVTRLSVPEPIALFHDDSTAGLFMHRLHGRNLGDAQLSPRGTALLQSQLADALIELHSHTAERFGGVGASQQYQTWPEVFAPMMRRELDAVREMLSSRARTVADRVVDRLDRLLPVRPTPRLVHGDIWATNLIIDDSHPDRPRLTGLVDPAAAYADREYELAYVRLFHTADDTFFKRYTRSHPLRPGFDTRCRIYWLHTLMLHVRLFGDRYVGACEDVARELGSRQ